MRAALNLLGGNSQGHCSYHDFSYARRKSYKSYTESVMNKKRKPTNLVWRAVSTQPASSGESEFVDHVVEVENVLERTAVLDNLTTLVEAVADRCPTATAYEDSIEVLEDIGMNHATSSSAAFQDNNELMGAEEVLADGITSLLLNSTGNGGTGDAVGASISPGSHSASLTVGASVMRFIGEKREFVEEGTGIYLIFPSSKEHSIVIQGKSVDCIIKASEKIESVINEAVKSPSLDYSHFISLPLAIHPKLIDKLTIQKSMLKDVGFQEDEHSEDKSANAIPLVSYAPKASRSNASPSKPDTAIAEPSFWNIPGVQPSLLGKAPSNATFGYWKILTPSWIAFRKQNIPRNCNRSYGNSLIRVVISLEARSPLHCEDTPSPVPLAQTLNTKSLSEVSEEIDERERLRRMKISKANSGKLPWNKGRKHSAETLQRIKEKTWLAMQNPKVKEKLHKTGLLQRSVCEETKKKIAKGVQVGWIKRREILVVQETCYFQWQNSITEAARGGFAAEEELQWDSYDILNKQLEQEWLESKEKRKLNKTDIKRGPKSLEQRRKIAASVAAKWADPEFRERVHAGMAKFRATIAGEERKTRTKPSSQPRPRREPKEKVVKESVKPIQNEVVMKTLLSGLQKKRSASSYKDPLSLSKLEMIKNIRAQRGASEMKRNEALERAKLLIVEAEKAVKALEAGAARSPIARASLIESKKLIAEAVQSIQSIENAQVSTTVPSFGLKTFPKNKVEVTGAYSYGSSPILHELINGNSIGIPDLESSQIDSASFNLYMLDSLNGRNNHLPISFKSGDFPSIGQNEDGSRQLLDQPKANSDSEGNGHRKPAFDEAKAPSGIGKSPHGSVTSTKKWVRGRLVEVAKGE